MRQGSEMMVTSDGNVGTNTSTHYWRMNFPKTLVGPITAGGKASPGTNDVGANLQTTDIEIGRAHV